MNDLRRLLGLLGPYRRDLLLGAGMVLVESAFELVIPVLMADIIDVRVAARDIPYILHRGVQMGVCALLALVTGLLYARFANRPANAHIPIARQEAVAVIRVLCRVNPCPLNHRIHPCIPPHVQNFPPCGIHGGKFAAALRFSCYGLQVLGCGNFGSAQFASWERPHPPTAAGTFPLGESEVG